VTAGSDQIEARATVMIEIPKLCLVVLVGGSGCGKSTFASRHFLPTEVISSDYCRGLVSDDENDQSASADAFDLVHYIATKRLKRGKLAVIDATNVQPEARKPLVQLAREQHVLPVAIVFNIRENICQERNAERTGRNLPPHVIRRHHREMRRSLRSLRREGFRYIFQLDSPEQVNAVRIERVPLWTDKTDEDGPFDIIGDIHGCYDELRMLLEKLGYDIQREGRFDVDAIPPHGRKSIFLGDLTDRGPKNVKVLRLVMGMVASGHAYCLPGNHDDKLKRYLQGRNVRINHGLENTVAELERESSEFREEARQFLDGLVSHFVLDDGKLVVAHAGMPEALQGRSSKQVRDTALYGVITGDLDELDLPERLDWGAEYRGSAAVVYGHSPVSEPVWVNNTINIDTGCVFGGKLTTLRYPEREIVSVDALEIYAESPRPFPPDDGIAADPRHHDDLLDINDVLGRRYVVTAQQGTVTIAEENAAAALEVMSRFAVDPRWLIYLPPTMSPARASDLPGLLEHPSEAFGYYKSLGVEQVVCEEKHMGSRAIFVLCRDSETARERFGVSTGEPGICYTRTGRRFFDSAAVENEVLERLNEALERAGFWDRFATNWVCLDAEVMPWSLKAQGLIRQQYGAVGAAAVSALTQALTVLDQAAERGVDVAAVRDRQRERLSAINQYVAAYRHYVWPIKSVADIRIAPFHLLATESGMHTNRDHGWHLNELAKICAADPELLLPTSHRTVRLDGAVSQQEATDWWKEITERGSEGIVVKPCDFIARTERGLIQPAIKVRGPEYLRIIYGPEYLLGENLRTLRKRGLGHKRSMALREFALGLEALERFVRREPLYRVHECVFGVLALESEPVDPRL
jgi:protein phosphatase